MRLAEVSEEGQARRALERAGSLLIHVVADRAFLNLAWWGVATPSLRDTRTDRALAHEVTLCTDQ